MPDTITTYFEADHDRLDELFARFRALKRSDMDQATSCFADFKVGFQWHIVWEEEILFPLFERKTGITAGPTAVMRSEHRQIRQWLEAIHDKAHARNPESDEDERQLLAVLTAHNQKEERVLYPAIDRVADEPERAAVFAAMEAVPAERYEICCQTD